MNYTTTVIMTGYNKQCLAGIAIPAECLHMTMYTARIVYSANCFPEETLATILKAVYTLQPVVQPAGRNVLNIYIINILEFCTVL